VECESDDCNIFNFSSTPGASETQDKDIDKKFNIQRRINEKLRLQSSGMFPSNLNFEVYGIEVPVISNLTAPNQ